MKKLWSLSKNFIPQIRLNVSNATFSLLDIYNKDKNIHLFSGAPTILLTMPSLTLPTPTPDELDDLIYFSRTGDLPTLRSTLDTISSTNNLPLSTILASAIDIDADGLGSQSCLLHWPAANGNLEVLQYLLSLVPSKEVAADKSAPSLVNHKNVNGNTPLHWAALNAHLDCVKVLLAAGADAGMVNEVGHDSLFEAELGEKEGSKEVVEWMLKNCEGLEKGTSGNVQEEGARPEDVEVDESGGGSVGNGGNKMEEGAG